MNVFYCFCDCIYAAARAWLALLLADGIFERKRTKERFYKGQGLIIAFVLLIQFINNNFRYCIFSDGILLIMIITAAAGSTFLYMVSSLFTYFTIYFIFTTIPLLIIINRSCGKHW